MALNVVMIGASRSGKTSIIASMLAKLREGNENIWPEYFHARDTSDYSGLEGKRIDEVCLQANIDGMKDLLGGGNAPKLGALMGTNNPFQYDITVHYVESGIQSNKVLSIAFHDIPGEYYSLDQDKDTKEEIIKKIAKSQILVVAVDVPAMMIAKEDGRAGLNTVMNCTEEIKDAISSLGSGRYDDIEDQNKRNKKLQEMLRMVVFVPIKCEYWLQNGLRSEVEKEIKNVYADTIAKCANYENIQVLILPIETIGSLRFDHYSDEENSWILKYGEKPTRKEYACEDMIGEYAAVRCEKISEERVLLKNGVLYDLKSPGDELINSKERGKHPYCYRYGGGKYLIPYVWFRAQSNKFAPKYCELLFLRILKFSIMDLAKRTGHSAREAFDNKEGFLQRIKAVPDYLKRWFSGDRAAYSDVEQARCFQNNISRLEQNGVLDEEHITYIVNKENNKSLLPNKDTDGKSGIDKPSNGIV